MRTAFHAWASVAMLSIWPAAPAVAGSAIVYQGRPPQPIGNPPVQPGLALSFPMPDIGTATTNVTFQIHASAWSRNPGRIIGICALYNDNGGPKCAATAQVYANVANTHLTLVPGAWTVTLPRGLAYNFFLVPLQDTGPLANTVWNSDDEVLVTATW